MEGGILIMDKRVLTLTDIEELLWLSSELVWHLFMEGHSIDKDGNYIDYDKDRVERFFKYDRYNNPQFKYLNIRECKELQELSLAEVERLSVADIKSKYLYESLSMARKSYREDNVLLTGLIVSPEIPDDYLDALFCLAWKNDLKIWSIKWHENDDDGEKIKQ